MAQRPIATFVALAKVKDVLHRTVASSRDKGREKHSPKHVPHCTTISRHSDISKCTYKLKGISRALMVREKIQVCSGM